MKAFPRSAARAAILLACALSPSLARAQTPPDSLVSDLGITDSVMIESIIADSIAAQSARRDTAGKPAAKTPALTLVIGDAIDRIRTDQLVNGVLPGKSLLLRSASSLADSLPLTNGIATRFVEPQFLVVRNAEFPFSQNHGAMWAGRGVSTRALLGFRVETPYAKLIFAPQIIASDNAYWQLNHDYFVPPTPINYLGRGYTFPYYFYTFPLDQPLGFGNRRIRSFDMGESTLLVAARGFEAGVSNENSWWGPGIRNAMILSNNAPGFPHLFVRTGRPVKTPLGGLEVRWLAGSLSESRYFDTVSTNNTRSIASIAVTLQSKWDPNLTVGIARSVYASADNWQQFLGRWGDVFKGARDPNPDLIDEIMKDEPDIPGGRDQLLSLFGRWVFPKSGAEVYGEWGRTRLPKSIAEFLETPNHTQGYTIGMQWRGPAFAGGFVRAQGEITQLEQSATFRARDVGSWYTSTRVIQGYTNRGQVIGAAIGPGASSQFVAMDYIHPSWQVGAFAGRIRWNEDVHSTYGFPDYVSYCSHDVTLYPGVRGALSGKTGSISAEFSLQNRLNVLFQNGGGCPNNGIRLDLRNSSLTIRITPFSSR